MICRAVMDRVYDDRPFSPLTHLWVSWHLLRCPRCASAIAALEAAQTMMQADFFPPAPAMAEAVMEVIRREALDPGDVPLEIADPPEAVSFKSWVITGLIILISLSSAFFGLDFVKVAEEEGSSFLIPVGLTMGMVVSVYGALFIGAHLKELSGHFRLHS
jgi:hypothetical protein